MSTFLADSDLAEIVQIREFTKGTATLMRVGGQIYRIHLDEVETSVALFCKIFI